MECWRGPYPSVRSLYCHGSDWVSHSMGYQSRVDRLFVSLTSMYQTIKIPITSSPFKCIHISSFLRLIQVRPPPTWKASLVTLLLHTMFLYSKKPSPQPTHARPHSGKFAITLYQVSRRLGPTYTGLIYFDLSSTLRRATLTFILLSTKLRRH